MNPPYMGSGRFDDVLSKYVKDNYADAKADLFSVFMQMGMERLAPNGKWRKSICRVGCSFPRLRSCASNS